MNKLYLILVVGIVVLFFKCQYVFSDTLYGLKNNTLVNLDLETGILTDVTTIINGEINNGNTTYDSVNKRYFYSDNNGGLVRYVAIESGITTTYNVGNGFSNPQYDHISNTLYGLKNNILVNLNLETGLLTDVTAIISGEINNGNTTYDSVNKRYFYSDNNGGLVRYVDIGTGNTATYNVGNGFSNPQYDYFIPEPTTLSLFTLGSLALLRKRK